MHDTNYSPNYQLTADAEDMAQQLAKAFHEDMDGTLENHELEEVDSRNEVHLRDSDGCCATHDFCDANVYMDQAWTRVFGEAHPFLDDNDEGGPSDEDLAIWNRAWEIAMRHGFSKPWEDK